MRTVGSRLVLGGLSFQKPHRVAVGLVLAAAVMAPPSAAQASGGPVARASDLDCSDFSSQGEAQDYFLRIGGPGSDPDRLDADGDGSACDSLACPCGSSRERAERRQAARRRAARRREAQRRREIRRRRAVARRRRQAKIRERNFRRRIDRAPARITDVIDGDTVKVSAAGRRYTVRLLGLDTPETRKPGTPVECGGKEATAYTLFLAFTGATDTDGDGLVDRKGGEGVKIDLTTDPTQDVTDRFGRLLAYVDVAEGDRGQGVPGYDLGRSVVFAGYSTAYTFEQRVRRYGRFKSAENDAKAAGRGVWSLCGGDFHSES